jgi:two-component system phosphate regulon response regulator OmpR
MDHCQQGACPDFKAARILHKIQVETETLHLEDSINCTSCNCAKNEKTYQIFGTKCSLQKYRRRHAMADLSTRKDKILVVDDDPRLRELLLRYLTQEGFDVETAEDGAAMGRVLTREAVSLIVLDIMLPREDGLSICRRLRSNQVSTPIIMLTAKSEDLDRIQGLEVGADDYLSKPFNPRELLARINAVLRRRPKVEAPGAPSSDNEIVLFGGLRFDLGARTLHREDKELSLTTGEFAMLKTLVRHPRQPLSREKLALLTRGRDFDRFDRSLDVQVSRLRKLIEEDPTSPRYLQTVWGVGYVFVPDGD